MKISCEDVQDSLVEYLLNELDSNHRARVDSHMADGCGECRAELKTLTESVDELWRTVPNKPLTEELHRKIMAGVRDAVLTAAVESKKTLASQSPRSGNQIIRNPILQALLAFAAGILFMVYMKSTTQVAIDAVADQSTRAVPGINLASPRIPSSLQMSEKRYESTQRVSLRTNRSSNELRGHVLCDALTREIHIFCYGLQQPPSGMQYVLWLVGPKTELRAADRLEVDADGVCKAAVHWPEGDFRFVKVTLEVISELNGKPSNDAELTSNAFEPFMY